MDADNFVISDNKLIRVPLINAIMESCGVDYSEAMKSVKYNIITPRQLAIITGVNISTVQNLMRPREDREGNYVSYLTKVFPFSVGKERGPIFIVFDEFCYNYIIETYKSKANGRTDKGIKSKWDPPANSESEGDTSEGQE